MKYVVVVKLDGVTISAMEFGSDKTKAEHFVNHNETVAKKTGMNITSELIASPPVVNMERLLNEYM